MEVTDHCYKRAKERLGLSKKAFDRLLSKVVECGITHNRTKNNLNKWISSTIMNSTGNIKFKQLLYSDFMVLHNGDKYITVYKIPSNLLPITKYLN